MCFVFDENKNSTNWTCFLNIYKRPSLAESPFWTPNGYRHLYRNRALFRMDGVRDLVPHPIQGSKHFVSLFRCCCCGYFCLDDYCNNTYIAYLFLLKSAYAYMPSLGTSHQPAEKYTSFFHLFISILFSFSFCGCRFRSYFGAKESERERNKERWTG